MDYTKLSLFKIKKKLGLVIYRLTLLVIIRIYPVFYKELLEPAPDIELLGPIYIKSETQELHYEVKRIINRRRQKGKV